MRLGAVRLYVGTVLLIEDQGMSSFPDRPAPDTSRPLPGSFRPRTQTLLIVLIVVAAVYLITNHWLHLLDALPYLGVVLVMSFCMFGHGGHGGHGSSSGHSRSGQEGPAGPLPGGGAGHVH